MQSLHLYIEAGSSGCIRECMYCLVDYLDKGGKIKYLANV